MLHPTAAEPRREGDAREPAGHPSCGIPGIRPWRVAADPPARSSVPPIERTCDAIVLPQHRRGTAVRGPARSRAGALLEPQRGARHGEGSSGRRHRPLRMGRGRRARGGDVRRQLGSPDRAEQRTQLRLVRRQRHRLHQRRQRRRFAQAPALRVHVQDHAPESQHVPLQHGTGHESHRP